MHHVPAGVLNAFHHDLATAIAIGQRRGQDASQRRVLFERLDDLRGDLATLGERRKLLDEVFRKHPLSLQRPESFEKNANGCDRAKDDRSHEWAAGPNEFPHGPELYRTARAKGSLQAPPDAGKARDPSHGDPRQARRPETELDTAHATCIDDGGSRSTPARERRGAGL